jgi:hypothetical protein
MLNWEFGRLAALREDGADADKAGAVSSAQEGRERDRVQLDPERMYL